MEGPELHAAGRGRGLHRLRHLRGCLSGAQQIGSAAEGDQHAAATAACARLNARTGISFSRFPSWIAARSDSTRPREAGAAAALRVFRRLCAAAARRLTSNCSRSSSATGSSSPTPPGVRRFTAAICRLLLRRRTPTVVARPGQFALRGQRGVRPGLPRLTRQAARVRRELLQQLSPQVGRSWRTDILNARPEATKPDIFDQRERVAELKRELEQSHEPTRNGLLAHRRHARAQERLDHRRRRLGLRHRLRRTRSRPGERTQREGAVARHGGLFEHRRPMLQSNAARRGRKVRVPAANASPKKDLGLIAMTYGNIYVACVAMGAKDEHTLKAFLEAEAYDGPALIIAYSHCIAHGINMTTAMQNQKAAVNSAAMASLSLQSGPRARGENPLHLDSAAPPHTGGGLFPSRKPLQNADHRAIRQPRSNCSQQAQATSDTRWRSLSISCRHRRIQSHRNRNL